jgi:hypothetical protein
MKKFLPVLLLLLATTVGANAQRKEEEPPSQSFSFGIYTHTFGTGIEFQSTQVKNPTGLTADFTFGGYKLAREQKIESLYNDQGGQNYFYDKKNYAYNMTLVAGLSKKVFTRNNFSKIGLNVTAAAGPSLFFLKPYYVQVAVPLPGTNQADVIDAPFDASLHNFNNIVGEADFFLGMNEIRLVPGARARTTALLDFSASPQYIRAVELGLYGDFFFKELEIFDEKTNPRFRIGGSVAVLIGNAW